MAPSEDDRSDGSLQERAGRLGRHRFYLASFLVFLLAVLPVALARYLPLLDIASHESLVVTLKNILFSQAGSRFYGINTFFIPDLGFDLPGLVMAIWMSPELVGRVFVGLGIALTFSGLLVLNRVVVGRWSPAVLASALLLYNLYVLLGFLSYQMGIAVMIWALAGRIVLEQRAVRGRMIIGGLMGVILLFCHVSAFAVYAVMLAGYTLDSLLRGRRSLWQSVAIGAETLPAVLLFVLMSTSGAGRMHYDFPFWHAKIFDAIKALSSGSEMGDAAFLVGAIAVAALLLTCGRLRLATSFVLGLIALCVLYIVIPPHVSGGSYVDSRIPVVIVLLCLAATDFRLHPTKAALALMIIAGGAYGVKQLAISASWYRGSVVLSGLEQIFSALPAESVILQAECVPNPSNIGGVYTSRQPSLTHAAAMAAFTDRRFAAITWTIKGQQPLYTLPRYEPYHALQDKIGSSVCQPSEYQTILAEIRSLAAMQEEAHTPAPPLYLLLLRPPVPMSLASRASLVAHTPETELYRVN